MRRGDGREVEMLGDEMPFDPEIITAGRHAEKRQKSKRWWELTEVEAWWHSVNEERISQRVMCRTGD